MRRRNFFSFILIFAILLSSTINVIAGTIDMNEEIVLNGMNNFTIRQTVAEYFAHREDYLLKITDEIERSVIGIVADETSHIARYDECGIVLNSTAFQIESLTCFDNYAFVTATEFITYTKDGVLDNEDVFHSLTLYLTDSNVPIVVADAYIEKCSGFTSCSYVPPDSQTATMSVTGGSSLCILEVAKNELGTGVDANGNTKYGIWIGMPDAAWCAIFVCWCANHANVSTSVIPVRTITDDMMEWFKLKKNYYKSQAYGGTYVPQAGDILFTGVSEASSGHVGFVDKVENGVVWICDGNWQDQVNYHNYALSSSEVIGYAHPYYGHFGHSYHYESSALGHWRVCANCCVENAIENHSFNSTYACDDTNHWHACSTCGYKKDIATHTSGSGYSYSDDNHWKVCNVCNTAYGQTRHVLIKRVNGQYACKTCGYVTSFSDGTIQSITAEMLLS